MAEKAFDIGFGTSIDTSGLEKGLSGALSKAESDVIKAAAKITAEVQDSAQKQVEIIRRNEAEKIEEVKKGIQEQIAAVKAIPDLSMAEKRKEIEAIKNTEKAKIQEVKTSAKLQEAAVTNMAKIQTKVIQDNAKKQLKAVQDGYKKSNQAVKDFATGAIRQLAGMDQLLAAAASGPVAIGAMIVDMSKKAIAALNEMAEKWREQEQAEVSLQNAAKNNPYLNDRNVKQLINFADEMQRLTGLDNVQVLQTQTRLASLGRNQEQIQKILTVAADMAASGVMSFDEAVGELNNSLNGMARTSGRLYPELKNLSKEALASGAAIDIIAGKVKGSAAEAMKTGAGSVQAYKNAVDDLKKIIGEGWEYFLRGPRDAITKLVNIYVDGINGMKAAWNWSKEFESSKAFVKAIDDEIAAIENRYVETEEYQRLSELHCQAAMDGNRDLMQVYEEQRRAIRGTAEEEINSLQAKKQTSAEYMHMLEEEMRMLEVLYLMGNGGKQGVDYSAIEKKRAEAYLIQYEETQGRRLNIDEKQNVIWSQMQEALVAKERRNNEITAEERDRNAQQFREENQRLLDAEIAKILRKAEIEGKSADSLEVQKQILDANVQAYENLLSAAKEFIDGTAPEEQARFARLRETWAAYDERAEKERVTDEERKRRLAELAKEHEETQAKIIRIFEDICSERDRLFDLQAEQDHQAQLEEIIKKSLKRSIDFETQYRIEQAKTQQQNILDSLDKEHNKRMDQIREMREAEMGQYAAGSAARLAAEAGLQEELNQMQLKYDSEREEHRVQLEENTAAQIVQIEKEAAEAVAAAWKTAWDDVLSKAQNYLNAAASIAGSISAIWHNSIDYETNEKLRANDKIIQSDEERAAAEKKIMMESAYEKYKADMFAWSANVALATANAAMAVLNALSTQPWYAGLANSIIAGTMGAFQVAAVISAQPQPPRFHTGGIAPGRAGQEVPAVLRGGESVLTQDQFGNVMRAFANVSNSRYGGGTNLTVNVKNNAANMVSTRQSLSPEGLEIVVTQIVKKNLGNGGLDDGLALQRSHAGGISITP